VTAKWNRLENWSRAVVLLLRPYYCPFNRTLSRVVIGLHTRHNTLRRHLYIVGLTDSALCRRCGAEEEAASYGRCWCEALATLGYTCCICVPSRWTLRTSEVLSLGAIWNCITGTGLPWLGCQLKEQKGPVKGARVSGPEKGWTHYLFYSILFYSIRVEWIWSIVRIITDWKDTAIGVCSRQTARGLPRQMNLA
jgi:hypothetical protein